jgi:hypothetical protein
MGNKKYGGKLHKNQGSGPVLHLRALISSH